MNVDPTAESGPDGEPRRELRRQCSNYIARRIQRLSSRLSTSEKGTSHHHVSVCSCLRHASSNDPPLACRHRDGCCDGGVPLPEDPRRWRAHRHTVLALSTQNHHVTSETSASKRSVTSRTSIRSSHPPSRVLPRERGTEELREIEALSTATRRCSHRGYSVDASCCLFFVSMTRGVRARSFRKSLLLMAFGLQIFRQSLDFLDEPTVVDQSVVR